MKLTAEELERRAACAEQVKLFREVFGESAEVTVENAVKAGEAGLDLRWLVSDMEPDAWIEFDNKRYLHRMPRRELISQIWDEFWTGHDELLRELNAGDKSEKEHEEAMSVLRQRAEEKRGEITRIPKTGDWVLIALILEKYGLK